MRSERDAVEQEIEERTKRNPDYPQILAMAKRMRALERVAEELLDLGAHVTFGVQPPGWHTLLHKAAVALRKADQP
jgi:hypothetical protein